MGDDEFADVALTQDGVNFVSAGTICRDGAVDISSTGLDYVVAIRITSSAQTTTSDGYDVDGVVAIYGCGNEPEDVCADTGACYATSADYVEGTALGGGVIDPVRSDANNALGDPERVDQLVFTSLGYGGSITFEFDGVIPNLPGDDIEIVETTFGNDGCGAYSEFADVSVSADGVNFYYVGTVCKSSPFVDISDAEVEVPFDCVSYVRVANNDEMTFTPDGFDVDGIVALHNCESTNGAPAIVESNNGGEMDGAEQSLSSAITSFPNPTTGMSQAVFTTGQTGRATLEVYDMNGRLIETLFNQEANSGQEYRADFNGLGLPNGVY
ncbi:MAG: T9SS type A sorting domain-containing protein, partial [Actinobacteria bacterium]|nr:T9SS type A sorting domain-containing protein [Actinomycetota bacterium]